MLESIRMKKTLMPWLIGALMITLGLLLFFTFKNTTPNNPIIDVSNKIHKQWYEQALGLFDGQFSLSAFRPQTINAQEIGSSSGFRVTWKGPEQSYSHFLLTVTQPQDGWTRVESREHDGFSLDLTDLLPDTTYVVNLRACVDPACTTWLITDEEPSIKTEKLYLQKMKDRIDSSQPNIVTLEKLDDRITTSSVVLLDEDGNVENDASKDQLTFGAVLVDKKSNTFYLIVNAGDQTHTRKLLNP